MSGEPVYFGLVSYNKNNKNILLGVINANGAKNFPHRRLYYTDRAGPILSAEEQYNITTIDDAIIGSNITM